jgi:hypothetical protein
LASDPHASAAGGRVRDPWPIPKQLRMAAATGIRGEIFMTAAYIEHRPLASDPQAGSTHHVVVVRGQEIKQFNTQREAAEWAKAQGYKPVHVARERHLQNRDVPDHWRHYS